MDGDTRPGLRASLTLSRCIAEVWRRGGRERFFRFRARYGYGPRRIVSSRRVYADGNATDREGMRGLTVSDVFDLFGDPEIVRRTSLASDRARTVARFRVLHPGE